MTAYEPYSSACPRCGYTEAIDQGPYDYIPDLDDALGGPPDPRIHLLWCGRCGKPFDAGPPEADPSSPEYAPYTGPPAPLATRSGLGLLALSCGRGHTWSVAAKGGAMSLGCPECAGAA